MERRDENVNEVWKEVVWSEIWVKRLMVRYG